MIAPGTPPAKAPSTWPGSERSVQAGWRSWSTAGGGGGADAARFRAAEPVQVFGGEAAGKLVADSWTATMLGLWNAGLWVMRLVLRFVDALLTPDLSETGPGAAVYSAAFWLAGGLLLIMMLVQLGFAVARRDGQRLATVLIGSAQFLVVWAGWLTYGVAVVLACGGLTRGLMGVLLKVNSWSAWQPWTDFEVADITDATVATVLGLLGLVLWLAAIGHLLVMVTRAGALIVLAAMTPVTAAGLVSDAGRGWFWKSLRWFHAAAFTPVLMVVMLGVGVQLTTGVANGLTDSTQKAIGTALPGVILMIIACFSPLALFKLLAFVDPTTNSGAALRQGLAATGGIRGLLSGRSQDPAGEAAGGGATGGDGRSDGETAAEGSTGSRFTAAEAGLLRTVGGAAGTAAAWGLGALETVASKGITIGSDLTNQMGVGHPSYQPDFTGRGRGPNQTTPDPADQAQTAASRRRMPRRPDTAAPWPGRVRRSRPADRSTDAGRWPGRRRGRRSG